MSYREEYRVEIPGVGPIQGGFTSKQAAIDWAHGHHLGRFLIWAMGATMYVHQEVGR